jgi:uncharacterized protein (TIGR03437 family)
MISLPSTARHLHALAVDPSTPSTIYAGLAPGFAGLYQINVRVPADVAPGPDVPVRVTAGGVLSNTVTLPVAP